MATSKKIGALTLLLTGLAITGCEKNTEVTQQAATETIEVASSATKQGDTTTAVVAAKSTENSATAFVATTAVKTTTATIAALDLDLRQATLTDKQNNSFTVTARDDTANLEQVSVGDVVNTKHVHQVIIKLLEGKNIPPSSSQIDNSVQSKPGEMPLRCDTETVVNVYTVEAIDIEAGSFKLKNIEGNTEEFIAKDSSNLARAQIGDSVIVTVTDSFAIEVVKNQQQ